MRFLIFGPNGSGKGTQSSHLIKHFSLAHVESGGIFRQNIKGGTELGKKATAYIEKGQLVPDSITIPMVLDRLAEPDCKNGFILDGFPRNPSQASALIEGLEASRQQLDAVIIIELSHDIAKKRLLGRRNCPNDHPNNTAIPAIQPVTREGQLICWKCEAPLSVRKDDIDEEAIDQRLNIYFDDLEGTLAAISVFEKWQEGHPSARMLKIDGQSDIATVRQAIMAGLGHPE